MNDFTKEELIYLLKCADPAKGVYFESVCEKIQSMIENFCKHEKCSSNYGPNTQCDNCGEIW